jgi:hypothetical protein
MELGRFIVLAAHPRFFAVRHLSLPVQAKAWRSRYLKYNRLPAQMPAVLRK